MPSGNPGLTDPDAALEPPAVPVTRLGDVWALGRHRLLCGDATSKADAAMCLGAVRPHLMVTDPPYGVAYDPKWRAYADVNKNRGKLLVDENPLAAYCQAYARWVTAEASLAKMAERDLLTNGLMIKTTGGNAIQNPLVGTANKAASDMVRYATEFGFTPAARARIASGSADGSAKSKFAGLIGGMGGRETDAVRQAARCARYQVYRNPDGPERDGAGPAVQAGDLAEEVHPGHLRAASPHEYIRPGAAPPKPRAVPLKP
jgi:P27 family predicted phage terminase small subunit